MCVRLAIPLLVVVAALAAAAATAAPPPEIASRQARAERVLAEIQQIDARLDRVVDAWNGARLQLQATRRELDDARARLDLARRGYRQAQRLVARRLVALYTSDEPSSLEVLLGSTSLVDLL